MNWKSFITPIHASKIFKKSPPDIIRELFGVAGGESFTVQTARSWLNENRQCKVKSYFPNGKSDVKTKCLYSLFNKKTESDLQQLQKEFEKTGVNRSNSFIDVETDDLKNVFCWSLVNQFLDLLGFQSDVMPLAAPLEPDSIEGSQPLDTGDTESSEDKFIEDSQPFNNNSIVVPDERELSITLLNEEKTSKMSESIMSKFMPNEGNCCFRCGHWHGDRSTIGAYRNARYGSCKMYGGIKRLSSTPACKDFKKYQGLPGEFGVGQFF